MSIPIIRALRPAAFMKFISEICMARAEKRTTRPNPFQPSAEVGMANDLMSLDDSMGTV
jgi:hypothetical protein